MAAPEPQLWECGQGRLRERAEAVDDLAGEIDVVGFRYRITARREHDQHGNFLRLKLWCEVPAQRTPAPGSPA